MYDVSSTSPLLLLPLDINMGTFSNILQGTFKDTIVGTLNLCFMANNIIEKVCWLLMGIIGTIWAIYFITFMVNM